jgi:hypothetical protein
LISRFLHYSWHRRFLFSACFSWLDFCIRLIHFPLWHSPVGYDTWIYCPLLPECPFPWQSERRGSVQMFRLGLRFAIIVSQNTFQSCWDQHMSVALGSFSSLRGCYVLL